MPGYSNIKILADYRELDRELDRIERQPDGRMTRLMNAALAVGFDVTQANVHVQTGSLKSSGTQDHDVDRALKHWEGEIQYGGPSGGVNNPVDYAIYEQRRGGAHDFMAGLELLKPLFVTAMKTGLSPERGR